MSLGARGEIDRPIGTTEPFGHALAPADDGLTQRDVACVDDGQM